MYIYKNNGKFKLILNAITVLSKYKEEPNAALNNKYKYPLENYLGIIINTKSDERLNNAFIYVRKLLVNNHSISREEIFKLLDTIDFYLFGDLEFEILHFDLRPSVILKDMFQRYYLTHIRIKGLLDYLLEIYNIYGVILKQFVNNICIKLNSYKHRDKNITRFILQENIMIKLRIEEERKGLACVLKWKEQYKPIEQIILYSNNIEDIYSTELMELLKMTINKKPDQLLINKFKINKLNHKSNRIEDFDVFEYQINIHDKCYLIKTFTPIGSNYIPVNIYTVCLNFNNNFKSLGYLEVMENSELLTKTITFVTVEEEMDFNIKAGYYDIFRNNEDQIFNFLIDLLNIIGALNNYKIKLLEWDIVFSGIRSVDRWRFRIDEIGDFVYIKEGNLYENYALIIETVNKLLKISIRCEIFDLLLEFKILANNLEKVKNKD